jgi:hypothetical protein
MGAGEQAGPPLFLLCRPIPAGILDSWSHSSPSPTSQALENQQVTTWVQLLLPARPCQARGCQGGSWSLIHLANVE